MMISMQTRPPFSLVFVMDPASGELPESLGSGSITVGPSSVAVGTLADADGPTEFYLGLDDDLPLIDGLVLRWQGTLSTSGRVGLVTAENEVLLECPGEPISSVQIWTNDESEPDRVVVLLQSTTDSAVDSEVVKGC
jgi:hypothetical protein